MAETVLDRLVTILSFDSDFSGLRRFDDKVRNVRKRLDDLSSAGFNVGRQLTVAGGVVAGAFGATAKQAIQWESDFTGVRKTVNATEEEFAALESTLRQLARDEVPISAGDLARIAEMAGQLGIETASIAEFVKVIAQLGTTTNLTSEQGAQDLARFANNTNMAQGDFDRLGATVVELGNNFATTEQEIVDMALRLAGAGELVGLTESDILSISAALSSVGINAEAGGTAFSRVLAEMHKSVLTGGDDLEAFGRAIGKTGGEFAGIFTVDGPDAAIVEFLAGLQHIVESGENVHATLEELGFADVRVRDTLLRLTGAGDLLTEAMQAGSAAWDENLALTREAELRYGTMASRFQFAKNRLNDLAITVGGTLAPILTDMVDRLEPVIQRISEFAEAHPAAIKWAAALALIVSGLGVTFIALAVVAKAASFILGGVSAAMTFARFSAFLYRNALLATRAQLLLLNIQLAIARARVLFAAAPMATLAAVTWLWNNALLKTRLQLLLLNIQLGIARARQMASAAVTGIVTAATFLWRNAMLATRAQLLLLTAATIASRAVAIAATIGTGLWTAAQWALNVALTANPIGLLIVGIAALIAIIGAVVFAVWHFRDEIMGALTAVWDWVKGNWETLGLLLLGPFGWAILAIRELFPDLFNAGKEFLMSFIGGFLSVKDQLVDTVKGALDEVRDFLPFSDAKRGPLADLTASGQSMIDTFTAGVKHAGDALPRTLRLALPDLPELTASLGIPDLDALTAPLPVGPAPQPSTAGAGDSGPRELTISIDRIEINAPGGDPETIAAGVTDALARQMRALVEVADTRVRV